MLTIRCAWCRRVVGTKDGNGQTGETGTVCPECIAQLRREAEALPTPPAARR